MMDPPRILPGIGVNVHAGKLLHRKSFGRHCLHRSCNRRSELGPTVLEVGKSQFFGSDSTITGTVSPTSALGSPLQVTSKTDPGRLIQSRSRSNPVETIVAASFKDSLSSRTATESERCFFTLTTLARIACFTYLVRKVGRRRSYPEPKFNLTRYHHPTRTLCACAAVAALSCRVARANAARAA
jgi:hypothetical protein